MSHPERTTTVRVPHRCGSRSVTAIFVAMRNDGGVGMVIRECAGCSMRLGSYVVRTVPRWAAE